MMALCPKGNFCGNRTDISTSLSLGYYAVDSNGNYAETGGVHEARCEAGHYCSGGNRTACDEPGEYCREGSTSKAICAAGHFCPDSSTQIACRPGRDYCPSGSIEARPCLKGATCLVPGAPELIMPKRINELRESELQHMQTLLADPGSRTFAYNISLSAPPTEGNNVTVHIELNVISNSGCVDQRDRIRLVTRELAFSALNYDVPQAVSSDIFVVDLYQGTLQASFEHSVQTSDPFWNTAILLPVSLTLLDSDPCPFGAQSVEDVASVVRTCACMEQFYVTETDPYFCDSATACEACVAGMECDWDTPINVQLVDVLIEPMKYRDSNTSILVAPCPIDRAMSCAGNATAGDYLCREGHVGPLCQVCRVTVDRTYVWSNDVCTVCDQQRRFTVYVIFTVILVIFCGITFYLYRATKDARFLQRHGFEVLLPLFLPHSVLLFSPFLFLPLPYQRPRILLQFPVMTSTSFHFFTSPPCISAL
jgi:hypothetical protein